MCQTKQQGLGPQPSTSSRFAAGFGLVAIALLFAGCVEPRSLTTIVPAHPPQRPDTPRVDDTPLAQISAVIHPWRAAEGLQIPQETLDALTEEFWMQMERAGVFRRLYRSKTGAERSERQGPVLVIDVLLRRHNPTAERTEEGRLYKLDALAIVDITRADEKRRGVTVTLQTKSDVEPRLLPAGDATIDEEQGTTFATDSRYLGYLWADAIQRFVRNTASSPLVTELAHGEQR